MGKRKGRRTRSDSGGSRVNLEWTGRGYPELEHDALTPMGYVERVGVFARGVKEARGRKRVLGLVVAFVILSPFAIQLVVSLADALGG